MRLHFLRSFTFVLVAAAVALVRADEPKCQNPARECEQQIRRMLSGRRYLGVQVITLKPAGVVVKTVIPNSPAARADLKPGDRLVAVNGHTLPHNEVNDFKELLAEASNTGRLFLIVLRRGAYKKVEARLEPYPKEYIDKVIAAHLSQAHSATAGTQP